MMINDWLYRNFEGRCVFKLPVIRGAVPCLLHLCEQFIYKSADLQIADIFLQTDYSSLVKC